MNTGRMSRWAGAWVAAALIGWMTSAQAASTIPLTDDFESGTYSVGSNITGGPKGWLSDSNTYTTVSNVTYTFTATSRPLTNSTRGVPSSATDRARCDRGRMRVR